MRLTASEGLYPENMLTATRALVRDHPGAMLEFDVQALSDGTLVAFHDEEVDRLASGGTEIVWDRRPRHSPQLRCRLAGFYARSGFYVLQQVQGTSYRDLIEGVHAAGMDRGRLTPTLSTTSTGTERKYGLGR